MTENVQTVELAAGFNYELQHKKRVTMLGGNNEQCTKCIRVIAARLLQPGQWDDLGEPLGAHDDISGKVIRSILDKEIDEDRANLNRPVFSMLKDFSELTESGLATVKEQVQLISIDTQDELFEQNVNYTAMSIMGLGENVPASILDGIKGHPLTTDNQVVLFSLVNGSVTVSGFND